jgi:2-O-methyltransferase
MKFSKFLSLKYWATKYANWQQKGIVPKAYIRRFLPENAVILEAGAHIGTDTLEMAKLWQNATIHAFEPVPDLFQFLSKNTQGVSNIHIYPLALSDVTGELDIHISSGNSNGSSSILAPKQHLDVHPDVLFEEKMRVKTTTIDDWARQQQIQKIDMLWLDLQGYELPVLTKSLSILRGVKVIYTEVNLIENYENNATYSELKNWLHTQGFVVKREALAWKDGGNVLFIRENDAKNHG